MKWVHQSRVKKQAGHIIKSVPNGRNTEPYFRGKVTYRANYRLHRTYVIQTMVNKQISFLIRIIKRDSPPASRSCRKYQTDRSPGRRNVSDEDGVGSSVTRKTSAGEPRGRTARKKQVFNGDFPLFGTGQSPATWPAIADAIIADTLHWRRPQNAKRGRAKIKASEGFYLKSR